MAEKTAASKKTTSTKKAPAKKSTTKKTSAAKKAPATKASAKKTSAAKASTEAPPARRSSAEKAPAKKASSDGRREQNASRRDGARVGGAQLAGTAREVVQGLTGKRPESVTGLERSDDGWRVDVEVLELERIPSTTDVLATYEVTLDEQGELQGYRRVHRYLRGSPGDD
jgi:hypothetical protein